MTPAPFCGRRAELQQMLHTWEQVTASGEPRVMVILAESGLGKTRLAQEFFALLAARQRQDSGRGYWPAALGSEGNSLRVNADLEACEASLPMEFLWWGIRLVDPLSPNSVGAGVLSGDFERHLKPHLEPFYRANRRAERRGEALGIGKGLLFDVAVDFVPFAGIAKSVGEAALELRGLYRQNRADAAPVDMTQVTQAHKASLTERIIADLSLFFMREQGADPVPGIILIDDAQFSDADPGMVAFLDALWAAMDVHRWPLLVLISHWEREWSAPAADAAATIAALVRAREHDAAVRTEILRLLPVEDLSTMLDARLPGLTAPQRDAILARADGNPRFLNEMLLHATSVPGRALFEGRNAANAMTAKGLEKLLELSVRLHDLIAERLGNASDAVQQAITLGSLQGMEFLPAMIAATAGTLGADEAEVAGAVSQAEAPHAYVAQTDPGVAAFAQRIYYEVAREFLPACFDPDEAGAALADALRRLAQEGSAGPLGAQEERGLLALMAGTFEFVDDPADRYIASMALAGLVRTAMQEGDVFGCYRLAQRLDNVLERAGDEHLDGDLAWLQLVFAAAGDVNDRAMQARVLERMLSLTRASHVDDANDWTTPMLVRALVLAAGFQLDMNDTAEAAALLGEANAAMTAWPLNYDTAESIELVLDLHRTIALAYSAQGRFTEALASAHEELAAAERLLALQPDTVAACMHHAYAAQNLGTLARKTAAHDLARVHLATAMAGFRKLLAAGYAAFREMIVGTAFELLPVLDDADASGEKSALLAEATGIARELVEGADTHRHRQWLASILMAHALREWRLGRDAAARQTAEEAIAVLERNLGPDWRPQANLAVLHDLLAQLDGAAGDFHGALAHAVVATDLGGDELDTTLAYDAGARQLMFMLNRIWLEQQLGQHAEAAISLKAADAIREWLPPETLALLAQSLERLAVLRQAQATVH